MDYDPPPLGPSDLEIAVTHGGLCGSDLHMRDDEWGITSYPLIAGVRARGEGTAEGAVRAARARACVRVCRARAAAAPAICFRAPTQNTTNNAPYTTTSPHTTIPPQRPRDRRHRRRQGRRRDRVRGVRGETDRRAPAQQGPFYTLCFMFSMTRLWRQQADRRPPTNASLIPSITTTVQVGDRVGYGWLRGSCRACAACLRGEENLCPQQEATIVGRERPAPCFAHSRLYALSADKSACALQTTPHDSTQNANTKTHKHTKAHTKPPHTQPAITAASSRARACPRPSPTACQRKSPRPRRRRCCAPA